MRHLFVTCSLLLSVCAFAQESGGIDGTDPNSRPPLALGPGQDLLFTTLPGLPAMPYGITSQSFTGDVNQYQTFAADDFTIGDNVLGWRIEDISVEGVYFGGGTGPAQGVNVYILQIGDSETLPTTLDFTGPQVVFSGLSLNYTDTASGDFLISLPNQGLTLPPGDYWLIVQAEMALDPGGQWGWAESALTPDSGVGIGLESAWFQTQPFVVLGNCTDVWGRRISDCDNRRVPDDGTADEPDLAFALLGQNREKLVTFQPESELRTSENGATTSYSIVLAEQPNQDVTLTLTSSQPSEVLLDVGNGPVATLNLDFTPANWNQGQEVMLLGQDDNMADGPQAFRVTHTTQSLDPRFANLPFLEITGTNFDNECGTPFAFMNQLPDFPEWITVPELILALCFVL